MTKAHFSKPQRENVLAIIVSASFFLRTLFNVFWPFLILYIFKGNSSLFTDYRTLITIFILLLLASLHGYLSWKNFYFYIRDNEFIVEKGYLKKSITALPLEKIVSVNTDQKLLHQILDVVEVKVDSTGTKEKEIKIKAVKKAYALRLEQALNNAVAKHKSFELEEKTKSERILKLSPLHLLKVAITRNHLQGLLLLFVFAQQLQSQLVDFFKEEIKTAYSETTKTLEHSDTLTWVILIMFIILLSLLISLARTFLSYYNLKFLRIKESFLLQFGLLKKKKITIPFSRVQAIQKFSNPLQRLFQIATLRLVQASSNKQIKDAQKVLIPGCNEAQATTVNLAILKKESKDPLLLHPHWALRNRLFLQNSIFTISFIVAAFFFHWFLWFAALSFLATIALAHIGYNKRKYFITTELVHIQKGSILHTDTILELHKIQTVRLSQNIFQKKRETASLELGLAGIEVSLDYIPHADAISIKDFLLREIIESKKDWM